MQEETKMPRKPWTEEDDATMLRLSPLGADALATALQRPKSQIRNRAAKLGISLRREGEKRGRKSKSQTTATV